MCVPIPIRSYTTLKLTTFSWYHRQCWS